MKIATFGVVYFYGAPFVAKLFFLHCIVNHGIVY